MLYVLYGTERLLMDQRLDKLKKDHHCNQEQMNYTVYDVSKEGMKVVLEDVMTPPFLSDEKMVVIKKADFLTTKKIKKDNHDIDYFMQCLPYLDKTVHLVIFNDEKNFDERKKVVKMLRKEAQFYEINPLNYYKVSDTARQAVKKRNCTIDDDALELLLSRKGTNLMDIAINEEPVKLIVLVANSMRLIYQVKLLDRKGYTDQEIAKMLAVNPFRLKYVRKEGQFFQIDELLRCLNELSLLDVKIKTGQIDKKLGLELFMLRI